MLSASTSKVQLVTSGSIRDWQPSKHDGEEVFQNYIGVTILNKIVDATERRSLTLHLHHRDLHMLKELHVKEKSAVDLVSDRMAGEGTIDDVGVFTHVYFFDTDELVDLINETVTPLVPPLAHAISV